MLCSEFQKKNRHLPLAMQNKSLISLMPYKFNISKCCCSLKLPWVYIGSINYDLFKNKQLKLNRILIRLQWAAKRLNRIVRFLMNVIFSNAVRNTCFIVLVPLKLVLIKIVLNIQLAWSSSEVHQLVKQACTTNKQIDNIFFFTSDLTVVWHSVRVQFNSCVMIYQ